VEVGKEMKKGRAFWAGGHGKETTAKKRGVKNHRYQKSGGKMVFYPLKFLADTQNQSHS
jgi:hypothetical protein